MTTTELEDSEKQVDTHSITTRHIREARDRFVDYDDDEMVAACDRVLSEQKDGCYPVEYVEIHGDDLELIVGAIRDMEGQ